MSPGSINQEEGIFDGDSRVHEVRTVAALL